MRILITGGAGFLGSHLSDLLLQAGHSVICMDNLVTGRMDNVAHLLGHERFEMAISASTTPPAAQRISASTGNPQPSPAAFAHPPQLSVGTSEVGLP